jgi:uncharacterized protein involved in exopolysaccharide biosynthesis
VLWTLLGLLAAVAALPLMDTRYLATAKVFVQLGREMTAPPTAMAKDSAPQIITSKRPEDVGSEIEIMKSRALIEELVAAFGADYFLAEPPATTLWQQAKRFAKHTYRSAKEMVTEVLILLGVRRPTTPTERVVVALQQALSVDEARKSDVISVGMRAPSPEMAVELLQKYLELFQEKHIAAYRTPGNREFFEKEADRALAQLRRAQADLARFKDQNKVWMLTEQSSLLLKTQRELADAHARTLQESAEMRARLTELRRQEASLPDEVRLSQVASPDPVADEMRKERAKLEAQAANAAVVLGERSPQMIQLRRELDTVNAGLASRPSTRGDQRTTGINQLLSEVRREIGSSQAQLTQLETRATEETAALGDVERKVRQLSATEGPLADMQREIARLEREYQLYTARLEESRISDAMDLAKIANVRVISPPAADPVPVFPPLLMMLGAGAGLGLCASLGWLFFADALRPVVRSRRDIENEIGIPVLARLPDHRALR